MLMIIAGVDEVGRGPLAGPVIAAAVILNDFIEGIKDSKALSLKKREYFAKIIQEKACCYAIGRVEVSEIETLNIHHATLLAMKRAIDGLQLIPEKIVVDGIFKPQVNIPCSPIPKADAIVYEVSAASILAKVYRDNEMELMDKQYPEYGFSSHKGYATKVHQEALKKYGPCDIHRLSFCQKILANRHESFAN